jgi:flagellar motor switch protein FliN
MSARTAPALDARTAADLLVGLLPSTVPLTVAPLAPGSGPAPTETAVVATFVGATSVELVLVAEAAVAQSLAGQGGSVSLADALRPALEAAAATLGRVRVDSERVEEPVAALDGLRDKGMFVAVPLISAGECQATFALQVTLPQARDGKQRGSLELLRHVAMEVTVEIGRTRMTVGELLSLHPGEVVELDRAASAPADLLVNGTLIARGEVVVVDEDFGLRISEIVSGAAAELGAVSA